MKGETPVNSTMSIGQARKMVEQLKIEASLCRIKVGATLAPISPPGLSCRFAITPPTPKKMLLFLTPRGQRQKLGFVSKVVPEDWL